MTVTLTTREQVIYLAKAENITIWALFDKAYREANKFVPNGAMIRKDAEAFDKSGKIPPYVYRWLAMNKPRPTIPTSLERVLHPPFG